MRNFKMGGCVKPGQTIFYFDRKTPVMLGDFIQTRHWFRKRMGRVAYVPGISKPHPELEFNKLSWVGIRLEDQTLIDEVVDPETFSLRKKIIFVRRDPEGIQEIEPSERIGDDVLDEENGR